MAEAFNGATNDGNEYLSIASTASPNACIMSATTPLVDFEEIILQEKVGHGSFGVVYKAVWRNRYVAVKEFGASAELKAIQTEIKQLSRVSHPNIIALYGISYDQESKYLIMEYAEGGSLHSFLHGKVKPSYTRAHAMSWARQCAEGVAYLHDMQPKPLIHRDLKPLNLLLTDKGRRLKICDFGTVADKSTMMTNNRGSAAWMAPEVFEGSNYTEKCDIFSWAIILWEVLSRRQPFREIENTYSIMWKIHKGERPPLLKNCPERIEQLMISCWKTPPDQRPSMKYVVTVMNEISLLYEGADVPLEYEFVNQQIKSNEESNAITTNGILEVRTNNISIYSDSSSSTPTNSNTNTNIVAVAAADTSGTNITGSSTTTISNDSNSLTTRRPLLPPPPIDLEYSSNRWGAIPEEETDEHSAFDSNDSFNLTPSAAASQRYETIRNGMIQMACKPMAPLLLDVDTHPFDLSGSESSNSFAKTDGKERLTVTDAKPLLPPTADMLSKNADNAIIEPNKADADNNVDNNDEDDNNSGGSGDGVDDVDQSLAEMLDTEYQPEPPIPNNRESQKIYREHRRLAKEYLLVVNSICYGQNTKEKLLMEMDPTERKQKEELLQKMRDREDLLELLNNVKQELENHRACKNGIVGRTMDPQVYATPSIGGDNISSVNSGTGLGEIVADDGWVVIAPNQNS